MTVIAFRINAYGDQRYQPEASASSVGKTLNIGLPDGTASGLLVDAKVLDDGRAVQLTMRCGEETARRLGLLGLLPGGYSIDFDAIGDDPEIEFLRNNGYLKEPWQDLQADVDGVTPYGPEENRS